MYVVGKCLLKDRLRDAKMTQQDLAIAINRPKTRISEYARNKKAMSLATAKSIAVVLKCHIDDLYEWVPEKS
ncbi:helix-turn-helix transcriptional regulator [Bacillus cereus]|nr:helix-turn-helix transcriptional regulator [Bacillus cereus]MEB8668889.1 helix-turn-helix transcriptional regulator [Bacillus cereus]